jgi:recombinational DNA repair protein (RecF pathway)
MNISQSSLKYLRHFQRSPFNQIKNLTIPLEIKSEIRRILDAYISSITERKLNSPEFIKQISDDNG